MRRVAHHGVEIDDAIERVAVPDPSVDGLAHGLLFRGKRVLLRDAAVSLDAFAFVRHDGGANDLDAMRVRARDELLIRPDHVVRRGSQCRIIDPLTIDLHADRVQVVHTLHHDEIAHAAEREHVAIESGQRARIGICRATIDGTVHQRVPTDPRVRDREPKAGGGRGGQSLRQEVWPASIGIGLRLFAVGDRIPERDNGALHHVGVRRRRAHLDAGQEQALQEGRGTRQREVGDAVATAGQVSGLQAFHVNGLGPGVFRQIQADRHIAQRGHVHGDGIAEHWSTRRNDDG